MPVERGDADLPGVGAALRMAQCELTEAIGGVGGGMASLGGGPVPRADHRRRARLEPDTRWSTRRIRHPCSDPPRARLPGGDAPGGGRDHRIALPRTRAAVYGLSHDLKRHLRRPTTLRRTDLAPFQEMIQAGVPAVMIGQAVFTALDLHNPAALSPPVQPMLRHELGFEGVAIADDLQMRSIQGGRSLRETAIAALRCGCDLLLVDAGSVLTLAHESRMPAKPGNWTRRALPRLLGGSGEWRH
jgi:hypothetical protein